MLSPVSLNLHIARLGLLSYCGDATTITDLSVAGQRLGKLGSLPYSRSLIIEDIDGDCDDDCKACEDERCPFKGVNVADVRVDCTVNMSVYTYYSFSESILTGSRVHGGYACEEIPSETIAAGGRCRVWSIAGNHVVNRRHVNAELYDK